MPTTDDCKQKLLALYPATQAKFWKRKSKYLNDYQQWERVFEYTQPGKTQLVILQERGNVLVEVLPPQSRKALPDTLAVVAPSAGMARRLFGSTGPEPLSVPFSTPDERETSFLVVLQNTIDWDAPEDHRSSYDMLQGMTDLEAFVERCTQQGIDLLGSYLSYMAHQMDHLSGLDEETFLDLGVQGVGDDSVADLLSVFLRIRQGYDDNGYMYPSKAGLVQDVVRSAQSLRSLVLQSYGASDEEAQEVFACIKQLVDALPTPSAPMAPGNSI